MREMDMKTKLATWTITFLIGCGLVSSRLLAQTTSEGIQTTEAGTAHRPCPPELEPEACRVFLLLSDSVEVYRAANDYSAEGRVLSRIGQILAAAGVTDSARPYYLRAVQAQVTAGDSAAVASTRHLIWLVDVVQLLNRSPLLEPTMGTVAGQRYVTETRRMLAQQVDSTTLAGIRSPQDATRALETVLDGTVVHAKVQSHPSNVIVQYRRLTEPPGAERTVTTDDMISLPAALYLFLARDPVSGRVQPQTKDCAVPCLVRFVFPSRND
jgi:hypothetical protein